MTKSNVDGPVKMASATSQGGPQSSSDAYWSDLLGQAPSLELAADRPGQPSSDPHRERLPVRLDAKLLKVLQAPDETRENNLAVTLLACWTLLQARMANAADLVVDCKLTIAGEQRSPLLRLKLDDALTGSAMLQNVSDQLTRAWAHEDVPARLRAGLSPCRLGFAWHDTAEDVASADASVPANPAPDLSLLLHRTKTGVEGWLEYAPALFDAATIGRMFSSLQSLATALAKDPGLAVDRLPLMTAAERRQVLLDWNAIGTNFAAERCLHELFEQQAARTPHAPALTFEGRHISYGELNARANRLAHYLISLGVKPDGLVAIALPRHPDMVVALLATLKAGGAYVPLDPAYPADRLAFMVEDSAPRVLITTVEKTEFVCTLAQALAVVELDAANPPWSSFPDTNPDPRELGLTPRHMAYVIYTSGSTGKPKGVMVEHANVVRLFGATDAWFHFDASDVWTLFHSCAFDFSVWEIWGALLYGGRLVVVPYAITRSPLDFYRLLCDESVTILNQTPSAFRQLMVAQSDSDRAHKLRTIVFGGEALEVASLEPWYARNGEQTRLINMYGITETTVHVTYRPLHPDDTRHQGASPIGSRIPDLRIYILDKHREPVPVGVAGELYVSGAGVARGYLNRPELSAERFIPDPFAGVPGERMYKTGDLGRWLVDGSIEFIARNDSQVKIRGFRIETGEIESVLSRHPAVRDCAVVAQNSASGEARLVAYAVCAVPAPGVSELREHLSAALPDFMVPAAFVFLPALPLTVNGKLDRAALPEPLQQRPEMAQAYFQPQDDTERLVCRLFGEQVGIDRVGRLDNFFELGGNSLAILRLQLRIKEHTGKELSPAVLFNQPTPAAVAAELGSDRDEAIPARRRAQRRNRHAADSDAIAIVAVAGRFPGAPDVETLWRNLCEGLDTVTHFTDDQLDPSIPAELRNDPTYVKARNVIADADKFDAAFFGISPREAEVIDPQQRIFLELCWECLERGGYIPDACPMPVGVFAGMNVGTYFQNHVRAHPEAIRRIGDFNVMLGNEKDYVTTRVAHRLNLMGPAVSVHTACSTSLVAVVQAVTSLRAGQCDMALAGGVSITCPVESGYLFQDGSMLSSDGKTRTFDADAEGTVFGDGAAVLLLKRLPDALADGDPVIAVIRGTGINNDGGEKASFTAPSVDGQAAVIVAALNDANLGPDSISYVEAHGTATPLGDPIEIEALTKAYRLNTAATGFCRIGSIKSNLGHMVTAAGAGGLIKTALSLHNEALPASLHYRAPNPKIDFAQTPFVVNDRHTAWPRGPVPRRAGVSSFGVGGTNAHVIVEEAPPAPVPEPGSGPQLFLLSARTTASLRGNLERLAQHLDSPRQENLADVAYTLRIGRKAMGERACIVAATQAEAVERLRGENGSFKATGKQREDVPQVVFMFPGQAAQYAAMGAGLYAQEPAFRDAFDECLVALAAVLDFDLKHRLFSGDAEALTATATTQPALFCVEYALACYWMSLGVQPAAMIGHSVGEFAAATIAGIFTLADAARLVARRGQLMQDLPAGAMLAVRHPASKLVARLPANVSLAAENSPTMSVVAGTFDAVETFRLVLESEGISSRVLQTSHAFHSAMMDAAVAPFEAEVRKCTLSAPKLPIYSTVTARRLSDAEALDPGYWARHLRETVRFSSAVENLMQEIPGILLELGPRTTLCSLVQQHSRPGRPAAMAISSMADTAASELTSLRLACGRLWIEGASLSLEALDPREQKLRVTLPGYAFERHRHWLAAAPADDRPTMATAPMQQAAAPLLVTPAASAIQTTIEPAISWTENMTTQRIPDLIAKVRDVLEDISGIDLADAPSAANFVELGLDSLTLTQVAIQLKQTFKVNITFRQLMESYGSLDTLAAYLALQMPAPVAAPAPMATTPVATNAATSMAAMPAPQFAPVPLFPAATTPTLPMVHQVIQQQMQIMSQQLALLQGVPMAAPSLVTPQPVAAPQQAAAPLASNPADGLDEAEIKGSIKYDVKKAFGAIARIHTEPGTGLSERKRARLDAFQRRYVERTKRSKEYTQANRAHLADPRVVNGFRPMFKEMVYQIVVDRSKGAKLWDLDGNEYVDVTNGFGMSLFGWQPPFVVEAVKKQIDAGYEIGPLHPLAGEVAKLVCEMTGHDRAGLCNTGSEAVMGAMRIARTVTGRNLIVLFSGSYHGIFDEVIVRGTKRLRPTPAAPGILPNTTEHVVVLDYGTPEALEFIRSHADEIAAVLVEPVQSRRPDFQPVEFLREVRAITQKAGAVFILDEVITGFRTAQGGIQELFGIRADICTYGKVIGGGFPVGVIAGKREYLDALDGGWWQYGDDSAPTVGVTYFAGTFVRHPLALAACKASLEYLKREGPELQASLNSTTENLVRQMNAFCQQVGAPVEVRTFASLWKIFFTEDHPLQDLLFAMMRNRGVHILDHFPCFMTTAHEVQDVALIRTAFEEAIVELQESEFLPRRVDAPTTFDAAHPPIPGARLGKDPQGNPAWFVPDASNPGKYLRLDA